LRAQRIGYPPPPPGSGVCKPGVNLPDWKAQEVRRARQNANGSPHPAAPRASFNHFFDLSWPS